MIVFYWVVGVLLALTFLPAALFFVLYITSGEPVCQRRAVMFWRWTVMIALLSFNFVLWKYVILGFWALIFH